MKKINLLFLSFYASTILIAENLKISNSGKMYVPGILIIKFDETNGNVESSALFNQIVYQFQIEKAIQQFPNQKYKSTPKRIINDLSRIYKLILPESSDIESICEALNSKPGISYAEPVYVLKTEVVPDDPYYTFQKYLPQIKAEEAWDIAKGDSSVIIAIIDTGVDWDHPDLAASIWKNEDEVLDGIDNDGNGYIDDIRGWDWVTGVTDAAIGEDGNIADNNPMDFDGHGTHVAGCTAAITNNGEGVASISWNCSIMPLRVGWQNKQGDGLIRMDWAALAYRYAAENGAHVANLSTGSSRALADAARYAFDAGVVITKSAGNDNNEENDPLDLEPFSITVAAVNDQDAKATYSSYGSWIKVSAPGGDLGGGRPGIYSTYFNDRYQSLQGTSFSAPITAGLAGLLKSYHPEWSAADITMQIIGTADNIDYLNPQYADKLGHGRINAYRAVTEPFTEMPDIQLVSLNVDDAQGGNGNGVAEAGEELSVIVTFKNSLGTAYNTTANLNINDWAIEVINGTSIFGDIPGLRDLSNNSVDNSSDPFIFKIDSLALPHRIKGQIQLIGDNNLNQAYDFIFSITPVILLVDDEELDNEKFYFAALDSLNISYEYWNHAEQSTPTNLTSYSTVIWSCEWTFPSLNATDRSVIGNYLLRGGNLFLSGQDIGWDLCDQTSNINEYAASFGASKNFYEAFFHAQYLLDDSPYALLTGVSNDPISDELAFNIYQPGRSSENQYPSEVTSIKEGISIFNYPNGNSGAVRYAGTYRTVYFAFGGYEAIVQPDIRLTVMGRVLDWLNGLNVNHIPLTDREDNSQDYIVQVNAYSQASPLKKVELYWDTDGELPYVNRVPMTNIENDLYVAAIPAQPAGTHIQYTIFVQTESGYYSPITKYSFHVGLDTIPPTFDEIFQIPNTIRNHGPYPLRVKISDNLEMDSNSVFLHFKPLDGAEDSLQMDLSEQENVYRAAISGKYKFGEKIEYYLTAKDKSSLVNKAVSDTFQFVIGLDDFENGFDQWELREQGWGLESENSYSGVYHASDSPGGNYLPGANSALLLQSVLDLSELNSDSIALSYFTRYKLQPVKAFGCVEVSTDSGKTWTQIGNIIKGIKNQWGDKPEEISLSDHVGTDSLFLRFRLQADASASSNYDGWHIDDVRIVEKKIGSQVKTETISNMAPTEYDLAQNNPNPFNPETSISYHLKSAGQVSIRIYNSLGQLVRILVEENKPAGRYSVTWNGKDKNGNHVSSGLYFYQMRVHDFVQIRKMLFLK